MRILDKYILKKYLSSLVLIIFMLIPIAIAINISEKIDKFLRNTDLSVYEIIKDYYFHFIIIYGNTFMPLALFIAVIFFTSKLAGNTEIIAIHSARISFKRFLRPYFIGATIVTVFSLLMNHFIVPNSNKIYDEFERTYITTKKIDVNQIHNSNLQLGPNDYIYIKTFTINRNIGFNFSYEHYDGLELKYKILGDNIKWIEKDSSYRITNYSKRRLINGKNMIESGTKLDTVFDFTPKDLLYVDYLAKEMPSHKLNSFIKQSRDRGISNLNTYIVEYHKRTSLPVSSYILTFIAVILASKKRRGGMGLNLAIGISLMFVYVFFMKVAEVLGASAESNPLFMVWLPNIVFGALAIYLYFNVKH